MKTNIAKQLTYWLGVVAIGLVVGLSLQFVRAWTEPSVAPPGGNIGAPVNTGDNSQLKLGNLALNANRTYDIGLIVSGKAGIGNITADNVTSLLNLEDDNDVEMKIYSNSATTQAQVTFGRWNGVGDDWSSIGPEDNTFDIWSQILPITFVTGATKSERMRINTNGNVGIGTASPAQKLDIVGNVRATDVCTTAGKCLSAAGGGTLSCVNVTCTASYPNTCSANCPSGYIVTGGSSGDSTYHRCVTDFPNGNGWAGDTLVEGPEVNTRVDNCKVYAHCCKTQ